MLLALARQVVSCPVSPADAEGHGEFTLPGLSRRRAHSGVSAAGSRRWGRSSMFQPNGWRGTERVLACDSSSLASFRSLPPAVALSRSPARNPALALTGWFEVQGKLL